jgi:subtilisin-like proprotein convertase family protein
LRELLRTKTAILLENAFYDTSRPVAGVVPQHLCAGADPGAYLVQSRAPPNDSFRRLLHAAGAEIVSYIPNNAYLVRASRSVASQIEADPQTQAVLPYEPYFKLKPPLLSMAVGSQPLPENSVVHTLLFDGEHRAVDDELEKLGLEIVAEEQSPFGPVLSLRNAGIPVGQSSPFGPSNILAALASIPGVQQLELAHPRVFANDLVRARIAVAASSTAITNYFNLTGTNVLINVNDSGVDASHPDLTNRVISDLPIAVVDTNGHGTHVAGIIAGSGARSQTITNASGSVMPAVKYQFRGMAPAAHLFVMSADPDRGPASDSYLQQTAARTNAFISNNSWHYGNDDAYDLAAASYDAAVRDALPTVTGAQPLLFVFGAGNAGNGTGDGLGGDPDSIQSPATAKNVITVGAVEQLRSITNEVWQCSTVNSTNVCLTNQPWLGMTDTNNEVAAFSSRGNVGIGVEGDFGRFKPDVVAPGSFVIAARSTQWDRAAYYHSTNALSDYFEVLSNLNETIGPFYRYESGTSMSAAGVSGTLALMQEFFGRLGRTNSPALMKALLINGARTLSGRYNFQVNQSVNAQGWGLINLTNSLPAALTNLNPASSPSLVFDQAPAEALVTGQSRTRFVSVSSSATNQPLRVTLVWTDPPANPAAGVKLVNNLDLVVTNILTGEVFFGNDFLPNDPFTRVWNTNASPNLDDVNNVENVYLNPPLGSAYSVTVVARSVNVNAVTAQTNGIAQDYALVISSGEGEVAGALTLAGGSLASTNLSNVIGLTNGFAGNVSGAVLTGQRVGASSPLLDPGSISWPGGAAGFITPGLTNQWRFYSVTNDRGYTNAAFVTFRAPALSLTQDALIRTNFPGTNLPQADIDLYVSTNPALTLLDPSALAAADKSLSRLGTEMVFYTNALPGTYYVGVKAEDEGAAEFSFVGAFSLLPFGTQDANGSWILHGINVPAVIPDGSAAQPGETNVIALAPAPVAMRRVVVTNEIAHESFSDLFGILNHCSKSAVLNAHSLPPVVPVPYDYSFIYEDNGEGDIPGSQPTDGPGTLRNFIGQQGQGIWLLTMRDDALSHTGLVENFTLRLDPQSVDGSVPRTVSTNAFTFDFIDVPLGATNLNVCLDNISDTPLPLVLYVRRAGLPSPTIFDQMTVVSPPAGCLSVNLSSLPPVNPGRYFIGIFNSNTIPQTVMLNAAAQADPAPVSPVVHDSTGPTLIPDDAVSYAALFVTNQQPIAAVELDLHVDHPRISDMTFTLISPAGTRVLLFADRGGTSTNGLGGFPLMTNVFPTRSSGDFNASTNVLQTFQNQGTLVVDYDFYALPDIMHVYYDNALIFDSGSVSNGGQFNIPFGPGLSTNLVIIMNEGNNEDTNTLWEYTASIVNPTPGFVAFTEDTNLAQVPVKYAPVPFMSGGTNPTVWYLPEQSLNAFAGQSAFGKWQLEMRDTRAGPGGPPPQLAAWQLRFVFRNTAPIPISLTSGNSASNAVPPGQIAYFRVDVPAWATFATNLLLSASAPVNLLFNPTNPPTGTNSGDVTLLSGSIAGVATIARLGSPSVSPGTSYYLGIQNPTLASVVAAVQVDFDINVISLTNGVALYTTNSAAGSGADYYVYTVTSNAVRAQFEIDAPSADMTLVARYGLPLPTLTNYSCISSNPGTNEELIVLFNSSKPVALNSGEWYLSAVNVSGVPATYSIRASEFPVYGTNILITNNQFSGNSLCLAWTSLPGVHYYVQGKTSLKATNWVAVSPTVTASDITSSWCLPLPSAYHFFRVHEGLVVAPNLQSVPITSISCQTNGVVLQWTGPIDTQFSVQFSPTLSPPVWTAFTNTVVSTNGTFLFHDDGAQCGGLTGPRYYRLQALP